MAKDTLYNFNPVAPVQVTRENYLNVGSGRVYLGDVKRGFKGGTDFEIWDAPAGGNQLTEDTDYELLTIDTTLTREAGYNVYTEYRILNPVYQAGNIYVTYKIVNSYVDAATINDHETRIDALETMTEPTLETTDDDYTFLDDDGIQYLSLASAAANKTFTLPTLADNQNRVITIINDDTVRELTIDGEGAETIDGMATIVLPKRYDKIKIIGGASEWKILEEKISCYLELNTYAGFGSTDNKIMRFTNKVAGYGNVFSENHTSGYNGNADGLEITINKSGRYAFSFSVRANAANSHFGISRNSNQLTTTITNITTSHAVGYIGIENAYTGLCHVTIDCVAGDVLRAHADGLAPTTAAYSRFIATYLG